MRIAHNLSKLHKEERALIKVFSFYFKFNIFVVKLLWMMSGRATCWPTPTFLSVPPTIKQKSPLANCFRAFIVNWMLIRQKINMYRSIVVSTLDSFIHSHPWFIYLFIYFAYLVIVSLKVRPLAVKKTLLSSCPHSLPPSTSLRLQDCLAST